MESRTTAHGPHLEGNQQQCPLVAKVDIRSDTFDVRFWPKADIRSDAADVRF